MIYYPSWDLTPKENSRFAPCWHWLHFSEECCSEEFLRKDRCGWRRQGMEDGENMLDQHVTRVSCLSHLSVLLKLWGKKFQTRKILRTYYESGLILGCFFGVRTRIGMWSNKKSVSPSKFRGYFYSCETSGHTSQVCLGKDLINFPCKAMLIFKMKLWVYGHLYHSKT